MHSCLYRGTDRYLHHFVALQGIQNEVVPPIKLRFTNYIQ